MFVALAKNHAFGLRTFGQQTSTEWISIETG